MDSFERKRDRAANRMRKICMDKQKRYWRFKKYWAYAKPGDSHRCTFEKRRSQRKLRRQQQKASARHALKLFCRNRSVTKPYKIKKHRLRGRRYFKKYYF